MKTVRQILALAMLSSFLLISCSKNDSAPLVNNGDFTPDTDTPEPGGNDGDNSGNNGDNDHSEEPEESIVIDNLDAADGWETVGEPVIIKNGQKEGTGYLQGTIKTDNDFLQFIKSFPDPIDTKVTLENGQLQFWFYVPDVSLLKMDGQIQFSSSNGPDANRIGWSMASIIPTLSDGWNHLILNFSDADGVTGDGGPDLSAMNYFKMFFWLSDKAASDQDFGIDEIKVVALSGGEGNEGENEEKEPLLIDNLDAADWWETVGEPVIIKNGQKEGTGYLQGTIKTGNDFLQFIKSFPENIDTKVTLENGQLQFWFYVPEVSLLKLDGQIQFSSSKGPDANRIGWSMASVIPSLSDGWNHLALNFADADGVTGDGGPDLSAMNYFKIFFWTNDPVDHDVNFGIDAIEVYQR